MSDTLSPTGVRVFDDEPRQPAVISEMTVEGWTEETRHVEATALVMLLDPEERLTAIADCKQLLDTHPGPAVAILERLAVSGYPQAARVLLDWLGEE